MPQNLGRPPDLDAQGNPIEDRPPDLDATGNPIISTSTDPNRTPGPLERQILGLPDPEPERGMFGRVFDWATSPIEERKTQGGIMDAIRALPDIGRNIIENPMATAKGFAEGAWEGVKSFTPLDIATTATGMGGIGAGRAGLSNIARNLARIDRPLSAATVAQGASHLDDNPLVGLAEMAGGTVGALQTIPTVTPRPKVNPAVADAVVPPSTPRAVVQDPNLMGGMGNPELAGSADVDEMIRGLGVNADDIQTVDPFEGRVNNASGTAGAGSAEEILRQQSMKNKGDQFVVYDKAGNERPIIGVDAQDYRVRPGETFGIKHADGSFTKYDDAGGKVPSAASTPSAVYLKNPTPVTIKKAMQSGYTMDKTNPIREDGAIRMVKSDKPLDLPILEAEVPLKQTRAGQIPPNKPPKGKAIDEGPLAPEPKAPKPDEKVGKFREAYELSRALMSVDLPFTTSAAFRQALPHIGTKNWFKAWGTSVKSYGSEASYQATMARIKESPLFRERPKVGGKPGQTTPSFADEVGLRMTDLGKLSQREEMMRSKLAEKIPIYGRHVRGSNRAYTAFLNDLRASTFEQLMKDSDILQQGGMNNIPLAKAIAEFINDTTGRSSLKTQLGFGGGRFGKELNLEKSAKLLTDTMFSPRLMASRIRLLNPNTYIMAPKGVRKQYVHGLLRAVGAWWGIASLAEMAGASVSKDPNSADFGKIKIGNTRLDPAGGLQQFLVLGSRMRPDWARVGEPTDTGVTPVDLATGFMGQGGGGITSSVSNRFSQFGQGYKPETRLSTLQEFGSNKLHPTLKLAYDIMRAQENRPVNLGDRTMQMALPIIAGDIVELLREDPSLLPLVIPAGTFGMGSQTYSGGIEEPNFVPDEWDIKIGGR